MKSLAAVLIALSLAACATAPKSVYYKPGTSAFDRESDAAACRAQAAAARVPLFSELSILNDCLLGKGYRLTPVDQVPL
jgi:uncharacterized lipoprotein YmbA